MVQRGVLERRRGVRRVRKDDAARLREIRLRALREAPYAFSSWFEREADYPSDVWERRATDSGAAVDSAVFVAVEAERWFGMAGGYFPSGGREAATLWACGSMLPYDAEGWEGTSSKPSPLGDGRGTSAQADRLAGRPRERAPLGRCAAWQCKAGRPVVRVGRA